jgi:hypothetical protein
MPAMAILWVAPVVMRGPRTAPKGTFMPNPWHSGRTDGKGRPGRAVPTRLRSLVHNDGITSALDDHIEWPRWQ